MRSLKNRLRQSKYIADLDARAILHFKPEFYAHSVQMSIPTVPYSTHNSIGHKGQGINCAYRNNSCYCN